MPRVNGVDRANVGPDVEKAFRGQEKTWGTVLAPYPVYARRPTIFRAVSAVPMPPRSRAIVLNRISAI